MDGGSDLGALAARVHALEKELADAKALAAEVGSKPLVEPPGLPDRFKEKALLDAVQRAFQQIDPKAEVTSIDCTEYPCIAYGSGLSMEQVKALRSSSALQVYAQDDLSMLVWNKLVGVIATPKDDPNAFASQAANDAAEQRIMSRIQQMAAASKAH